jgi:hypothetical protein
MTGTVTNIGPQSIAATLQLAKDRGMAVAREALGLPSIDWTAQKYFSFHRRKREGRWGYQIMLHVGRWGLNLAVQHPDRPFPPTIHLARQWAVDFANAHGFEPMQKAPPPGLRRPPRSPRLTVHQGGQE